MRMYEIAPDAPDWDDYEAEQEKEDRHRKRMEHMFECVEEEFI